MKKLLAIILSAIFVLSLCACGSRPSLSADDALDIALNQAGVTRENIRNLKNRLEWDDGIRIYEIDFDSGTNEYSFDVNAETGAIVERDRDIID